MNFYQAIAFLFEEPGENLGDFAVGMLVTYKDRGIRHEINSYWLGRETEAMPSSV
jgi:hypothetical protein